MLEHIAQFLVDFVHAFGYLGIFIMTFLESTFVPIPSEVTMVPAGYLVQQGHMALLPVLLCSILGTLFGSLANYWLAHALGKKLLLKYGKYFFFPPEKMAKLEKYFKAHGEVSIFTSRLIPGIRHVISFPAGLAHMNLKKFSFYTTLGGALWMATLLTIGYLIGDNKEVVSQVVHDAVWVMLTLVGVIVLFYILNRRSKKVAG